MTFLTQLIKILGDPDQFNPAVWDCGCRLTKIGRSGEKFTPCRRKKHKQISGGLRI